MKHSSIVSILSILLLHQHVFGRAVFNETGYHLVHLPEGKTPPHDKRIPAGIAPPGGKPAPEPGAGGELHPGAGAGAGEGGAGAAPGSGQGDGGQHGSGQGDTAQHGGGSGGARPPAPAPVAAPPKVEMLTPKNMDAPTAKVFNFLKDYNPPQNLLGPNDEGLYWGGHIGRDKLTQFKTDMQRQRGVSLKVIDDIVQGDPAFKAIQEELISHYPAKDDWTWRWNTLISMKWGEIGANRDKPVHVLYGKDDNNDDIKIDFPNYTLLNAETWFLTGPNSQVPQMIRYEAAVAPELQIPPTPHIVWTKGDGQRGSTWQIEDLKTNPRFSDAAPPIDLDAKRKV